MKTFSINIFIQVQYDCIIDILKQTPFKLMCSFNMSAASKGEVKVVIGTNPEHTPAQ